MNQELEIDICFTHYRLVIQVVIMCCILFFLVVYLQYSENIKEDQGQIKNVPSKKMTQLSVNMGFQKSLFLLIHQIKKGGNLFRH